METITYVSLLLTIGILCSGAQSQVIREHGDCHSASKVKLGIDTAFLTIVNAANYSIAIREQTEECHSCGLKKVAAVKQNRTCVTLVDTRWPMRVSIVPNNSLSVHKLIDCSESDLSYHFKAGGNYTIFVMQRSKGVMCTEPLLQNSVIDSNIPIYIALGIFIFAALAWIGLKTVWRLHCTKHLLFRAIGRFSGMLDPDACCVSETMVDSKPIPSAVTPHSPETMVDSKPIPSAVTPCSQYNLRRRKGGNQNNVTEQDLGRPTNLSTEEQVENQPKKERLKSLDTFRGLSIIVMIFVNYKGGKYWFFVHSRWNGLTLADLVFPWFVFIMGTAMAYSFQTLSKCNVPKSQIFFKILKRTCILFFLGLIINSGGSQAPDLTRFRMPGVLQRFAGTYLIIATMHMFFAKPNDPNQYTRWSSVRDVVDYWQEWIINLVFVTVWLLITFLLDVPGCPNGYLGPGGRDMIEGHNVTNCTGGAAGYIDRLIFGEQHIYQHPTCMEIYDSTLPYDPEGLLGTLNSCFICFLGLQAGKILVMFRDVKARMRRFLVWGIFLGLLGTLLCKGEKDGGWIPINKNLWSLSFVLVLAGMAFILLAFCYLTIDVYKVWSGAPFFYPGMNAIVLYMGHEIFHNRFPVAWHVPNTHGAWLALNLWGTFVWVLVGYVLYYKKIFISI